MTRRSGGKKPQPKGLRKTRKLEQKKRDRSDERALATKAGRSDESKLSAPKGRKKAARKADNATRASRKRSAERRSSNDEQATGTPALAVEAMAEGRSQDPAIPGNPSPTTRSEASSGMRSLRAGRTAKKLHKNHRAAVMAREHTEGKQGTPFEAYFASASLPADQPTLIFQHLQKTAGTAMRQIIHANMANRTDDEVGHLVLDVRKTNQGPTPLRQWYAQWWSSLDQNLRDRLILATSHSANYLLDLVDRPTRAFTIVREPLDRVVSRYYFRSSPARWTLRDLYRDPARHPRTRTQFFNYQSRALLEPRFDVEGDDLVMRKGPPPNAYLWRERLRAALDEHYIVGVQERFQEAVTLFGREFGWTQLQTPHVRVNQTRPREWSDEETRELVLAYNWLDVELYDECVRRMERSLSTNAS